MELHWDVLIAGGGPAGYSAALYCARAGLRTLVLEQLSAGGQIALTTQVDNYPGFPEGIDGFELGQRMRQGAERFGARTQLAEVTALELNRPLKTVHTSAGVFQGRAVIVATGANPRRLGLPKEKALTGRGVSYCAACDGMFYRGKTVAVVGGGSTAAADALLLSRLCKKVILIHRRDTLRAASIEHQALLEAPNVEFRWNATVIQFLGSDRLLGLRLRDLLSGAEAELPCDGVFLCIGRVPATALLQGQLELDSAGYLIADETTRTSIPGVFAAGDVRTKALRQAVTAAADGAVAAHYAEEYLRGAQ